MGRRAQIGLTLLLATGACSTLRPPEAAPPPLILVSFDGFRWDYLDRVPTPALHLYELMCHLLDLEPAANDGSLAAVRHLLRQAG